MRRNDTDRQGVAIVEFALVLALLLVPIMAGVWDISKFIDINQILTRAAREGIVSASRGDDPTQMIADYIESAGLDPSDLSVTIEHGPEEPGLGQEVCVSLAYDFAQYTVFPWEDFMPGGITTDAYAKME